MFGSIKNYVQDQIALVKLEGVEAIGRVASRLMIIFMISMLIMFFLLLLSFAGAFYLGELYGRANGFLIISGVYLLLIIVILVFRKSLQELLTNMAIAASMQGDDKENEN